MPIEPFRPLQRKADEHSETPRQFARNDITKREKFISRNTTLFFCSKDRKFSDYIKLFEKPTSAIDHANGTLEPATNRGKSQEGNAKKEKERLSIKENSRPAKTGRLREIRLTGLLKKNKSRRRRASLGANPSLA